MYCYLLETMSMFDMIKSIRWALDLYFDMFEALLEMIVSLIQISNKDAFKQGFDGKIWVFGNDLFKIELKYLFLKANSKNFHKYENKIK